LSSSRFDYGAAGRAASLAALLWLGQGSAQAFAQANSLEECGLVEQPGDPTPINDKAFDCGVFRRLIAAAPDGFKALRGPTTKEGEAVRTYGVTENLFGACQIIDKKKIGEIIYSCQAGKIDLADIKATVEACLGPNAFGYAGNENPHTPFLKYEPRLGDARARVLVLKTFGKQTLAIMNLR
jgi:hypothetical protein